MASGQTSTHSITTRLNAGFAPGGTITNTATVTSTTPDTNPANNAASDTNPVVAAAPAAVPTLTEWAMILFGALLAGGAALHLQHRRRAA